MVQTRRERNRETILQEIKTIAWKQIAEEGASSLSLRAIAREIGMTAPGLYRYYASRDDLVTMLMIDAFNSFAEYLESVSDVLPSTDYAGRYRAVCRAYFQWAATYPDRFTLIFGAPLPGYHIAEAVYPAAQRSFLILQGVIGEAVTAGKVDLPENFDALPPGLLERYKILNQFGIPYPPAALHLALRTWSHVHGITSLYLHAYLQGFLAEQVDAFVHQEIEQLILQLDFKS